MSWAKREPVTNLIFLGDGEDQRKSIGGLLIACPRDRMYPEKVNYEIVQKDGEVLVLSGSASLSRQINDLDIGKFIKAEFMGWGKSANGKFKAIDVNVWEGEPTDVMKKWPRYGEFQAPTQAQKKAAPNGKPPVAKKDEADDFEDFEETVSKLADAEDDLPF